MKRRQTDETLVRTKLRPIAGMVTVAILVLAGLGVHGCGGANAPEDIMGVMSSLKAELGKLSSSYPELAGAGDIKIISATDGSEHTVAYRNNCTFTGKRGYQDTGDNACAVALRVMTDTQYQEDASKVAMPAPAFRWDNLQLVGWTTVHVGQKPSDGFEDKMNKLIGDHVSMINNLDTRAAAK